MINRRYILIGALAGLLGGAIYGWALLSKGMMTDVAGLVGFGSLSAGLGLHFLVSALIGASYGALFRFRPGSYASHLSSGILYGLLWWILGPMTLSLLISGEQPMWSMPQAEAAFVNLLGHVLYGAVTGLSFYGLASLALRWFPPEETSASLEATRPHKVLILGGGFGGVSAAQQLEKMDGLPHKLQVTLVSHSNYLLFTPMLAEVASSALEPQHISTPIRAACPNTRFIRATVEAIDTTTRTVRLRAGAGLETETLSYDDLVLSLGSVPNFYGLQGMENHAFGLKTLEDAIDLRNHMLALLERADIEPGHEKRRELLTFVVVGGGFAGTEMIAEMFDLARSVLRYYPGITPEELRFLLIHSRDRILPELSENLANYSLNKLEARGIEFMLNARVSGATTRSVLLNDGQAIPTQTIVWTAGVTANPLLATTPLKRNPRDAVRTEPTLQAVGHEHVWAVGDCAEIPLSDPAGPFQPPTAQHALREGKQVADNIVALLRGQPVKPFHFRTLGLLVALGRQTGAAEILGRQFSGLLAWFLWRSIYLSKLPGTEKKVRVSLDWALDLFFPRDIVLTADTSDPSSRTVEEAVNDKTKAAGK